MGHPPRLRGKRMGTKARGRAVAVIAPRRDASIRAAREAAGVKFIAENGAGAGV
jgi:hypothetical protein